MNDIEHLVDQLDREHSGEPWHGSPLTATLDGVGPEAAAAKPPGGAHSIWELVLHITAWKNEVRHRLAGAPAGEPREGDWPAVGEPTASRWSEARQKLDLAHQLLVSAVKDFPEENLPLPTNDQRSDTIADTNYELLMGILQHDVYHAGQIALIKRVVDMR